MKLLIAGGGIGGLALAYRAARLGWHAVVLERHPQPEPAGYVMNLFGTGVAELEKLGLGKHLESIRLGVQYHDYLTPGGHRMIRLDYDRLRTHHGIGFFLTTRQRLQELLLKETLASGAEVMYAKAVISLEDKEEQVLVKTSSGEVFAADILIGADGVNSSIRRAVFPESGCEESLGVQIWGFSVASAEENFRTWNGWGHNFGLYPLGSGRAYVLFQWLEKKPPDVANEDRAEYARRKFASAYPQALQYMSRMDRTSPQIWDAVRQIRLPQWHSGGRVALLGDSAACLSLYSGQGAALALAAARILTAELYVAGADVKKAFRNYQSLLQPWAIGLQVRAKKAKDLFLPGNPGVYGLRNLLLRCAPDSWLQQAYLLGFRSSLKD